MFPKVLAADPWMFLHQDTSKLFLQGSGDFVVVCHNIRSAGRQCEEIRFEKILESKQSRSNRQAKEKRLADVRPVSPGQATEGLQTI